MHMTVAQILEATGSRLVTGNRAAWVDGCSIDTRTIQKGDLFVAFPGERVDGNDFVPAAIEAGAACVAMTREPSEEVVEAAEAAGCAIVMQWQPDSERFLLSLASFWREQNPTWVVVGVTGSVGKTTTKEMLAAAIGTMYPVHATSGNYNSLIGVALTVLAAGPEHRVLVLEMGMNHAGELFRQTRAVRPHLAVITNIGTSHIGNLGSREGIARAKAEILSGIENTPFVMGGGRRLYLRGEEDFFDLIEQQARYNSVDVVPCGSGAGNEVRRSRPVLDEEGKASFTITYADGEESPIHLAIPGTHVADDALLAAAVADALRCPRAAVAEALGKVRPYAMRLETVRVEGRPGVIDDSYNASPTSMAGALDVLAATPCEGRRVAVMGEMGEMGDDAPRLHGYVGAYAAAKDVDLLVTVGGELAAQIVEAAKTCGFSADRIESFATVEEAARTIIPILDERDLVLVKASRAAALDAFAKEVLGQ